MIAYRTFLAVGMVVLGSIVTGRTLALGLRIETLPGIVLGVAMIALGIHRLTLIVRARRNAS